MRFLARAVLIWLVVLAIPAKGIAASAMLLCGPSHHRTQQAVVAQDGHAHAHHEAADPAAHDHQAAPSHEQADPVSPPDAQTAEPGKLADPGSAKCSACASCCASVALPNDMPSLVTAASSADTIDAVSATAPPFLTDGPERPPRNFLA